MMQESINTILAFVALIKQRDSVFSAKDWQDLSDLDQSLERLNKEENFAIANTILDWCDEHPAVRNKLKAVCNSHSFEALVIDSQQLIEQEMSKSEEQKMTNKRLVRQIIQEAMKQSPPNS